MLKGKMDFRIGNDRRSMVAGDVAVIPRNVEHEGIFPEEYRGRRYLCTASRRFPHKRCAALHAHRVVWTEGMARETV